MSRTIKEDRMTKIEFLELLLQEIEDMETVEEVQNLLQDKLDEALNKELPPTNFDEDEDEDLF